MRANRGVWGAESAIHLLLRLKPHGLPGNTLRAVPLICMAAMVQIYLFLSVDLLLEQIEDYFSEDVILLSVYPLEISGKNVRKDFKQYLPPKK